MGLLALMRLHLARAEARFTADGAIVLLPDQDRERWDRQAISEAEALVERALRIGRAGPYQLQAAIVAVHADAPSYDETDWAEVVALYDRLYAIQPTPVVALNRALALAELRGPEPALAEVEPLAERLAGYHLYHAARGELLRRLGRFDEARRGRSGGAAPDRQSGRAAAAQGADRRRERVTGSGVATFEWCAGTDPAPIDKERNPSESPSRHLASPGRRWRCTARAGPGRLRPGVRRERIAVDQRHAQRRACRASRPAPRRRPTAEPTDDLGAFTCEHADRRRRDGRSRPDHRRARRHP